MLLKHSPFGNSLLERPRYKKTYRFIEATDWVTIVDHK